MRLFQLRPALDANDRVRFIHVSALDAFTGLQERRFGDESAQSDVGQYGQHGERQKTQNTGRRLL